MEREQCRIHGMERDADAENRDVLGAVDISMKQARSAQAKAGKWGSRRYLAVRQGPSALSFLM